MTPVRFTDPAGLMAAYPAAASPGEFDLLDARSLMERGDYTGAYTGAVGRSVTAIEAAVEGALRSELGKAHPAVEVERRLAASQNDFPGRFRQWKKFSGAAVPAPVEATFEKTRTLRHEIVHRARRFWATASEGSRK